jgi:hypothetical protein
MVFFTPNLFVSITDTSPLVEGFTVSERRKIYVVGSLRNPDIPRLASRLREEGHEVFDDWFSAGPIADDSWLDHQRGKGLSYADALAGPAATHVFEFDKHWLEWSDSVVLFLPTGRSGHIEFGYAVGSGRDAFVYFSEGEPERWDVMYRFATGVAFSEEELIEQLGQGRGDGSH